MKRQTKIERAIQYLDDRINELQRAREVLLKAAADTERPRAVARKRKSPRLDDLGPSPTVTN